MNYFSSFYPKYKPEYYLLVVSILACYTPPFTINALGITLAIVFLFLIVFKPKILGIIIGALFFLVNLYFVFAIVDEFGEFQIVNTKALILLLVGSGIIGLNLVCSYYLVKKNILQS